MLKIQKIYRYPVKGLSPEPLAETVLTAGQGIDNDRRFAIAPGTTSANQNTGNWIAKSFFLTLARNPKLAQLKTRYDDTSNTLTILRRGKPVTKGRLTEPIGRTMLEDFFAAFMGGEARGRPKIFEAKPANSLTDQAQPLISLINLQSVSDIERITACQLDPLRFRGNIYFEGGDAWQESAWVDNVISINNVQLRIIAPIGRCVATHVNLQSSERDINILKALQSGFGHTNCGVFAEVVTGDTIAVGDSIVVA